MHNYDLTPDL